MINKSYRYIAKNPEYSFIFRVFSETKSSYHIITETFDLFKVSKTEMINKIKNENIRLYKGTK